MKTVYFSIDQDILDEWIEKFKTDSFVIVYDLESLENEVTQSENSLVIADFDTVAHQINTLISLNKVPKHLVVLEKSPEIPTGKRMINSGVKAYGNSRMLKEHFKQMCYVVLSGRTWTYPKLTASLLSSVDKGALSQESVDMIEKRLTAKEAKIAYLILKGLTNDAIASQEDISTRTVKAHVSSIFNKLHVNDRISMILLLK